MACDGVLYHRKKKGNESPVTLTDCIFNAKF